MKVRELICFLEKQPQDLDVAYESCSELCILVEADVGIQKHCEPRNDGWIHRKRPDKELQEYLVFP